MKINPGVFIFLLGFFLMFFKQIQMFGWVVAMFGVGYMFYYYFHVMNQEKKNRELWGQKLLEYAKVNDINIEQYLFNQRKTSLLGIERNKNEIVFMDLNIESNDISYERYNFDDIIEAHISEDDVSVIKTSRGSQIGGALVGGAIAGGIGAIIGGLSSSKTQSSKVQKISLDIVVNNLHDPLKRIVVFEHSSPVSKDNSALIKSKELADRWFSLMKLIINKKDLVKES